MREKRQWEFSLLHRGTCARSQLLLPVGRTVGWISHGRSRCLRITTTATAIVVSSTGRWTLPVVDKHSGKKNSSKNEITAREEIKTTQTTYHTSTIAIAYASCGALAIRGTNGILANSISALALTANCCLTYFWCYHVVVQQRAHSWQNRDKKVRRSPKHIIAAISQIWQIRVRQQGKAKGKTRYLRTTCGSRWTWITLVFTLV